MGIRNATRDAIFGVLDGFGERAIGASKGYTLEKQARESVKHRDVIEPMLEKRGWKIVNAMTPVKGDFYVQWLPTADKGQPLRYYVVNQVTRQTVLEGEVTNYEKAAIAINKVAKPKKY